MAPGHIITMSHNRHEPYLVSHNPTYDTYPRYCVNDKYCLLVICGISSLIRPKWTWYVIEQQMEKQTFKCSFLFIMWSVITDYDK